jgi:hypothetical protein
VRLFAYTGWLFGAAWMAMGSKGDAEVPAVGLFQSLTLFLRFFSQPQLPKYIENGEMAKVILTFLSINFKITMA